MHVKICGLKTPDTVAAAIDAGVRYVGFVFFTKSPRHVSVEEVRKLAADVPPGVMKVALVVDPDNALIGEIADLPIDMIQLHGAETPDRVTEVKANTGLPVMKAIGISGRDDLAKIDQYAPVADQLLIDAKPPKDGDLPGGNGLSFDWRLVANREWTRPWMLAGGLDADNVAEAIALTGARQLDISSGVETASGIKDAAMIRRFMKAALAG